GFSEAFSFSEGLAAVQTEFDAGTNWGYIDTTGTLVLGGKFAAASDFREGIAPVAVIANR
ncbi:MAG TPA: WG repeat-containing protein, partial [Clostridia bacterium]|nr:WG repeat-containing protein [Clostridia bacterium]